MAFTLPQGTKDWAGGIISSIAGALSGMFGGVVAFPVEANIATPEGRQKLLLLGIATAVPSLLGYLYRRPLPGVTLSGDELADMKAELQALRSGKQFYYPPRSDEPKRVGAIPPDLD